MLLSELKVGEKGKIVSLNNTPNIKLKLQTMGVVRGVEVQIIRKALFFGPIEIKVKDFYLAIRISDAKNISVVKNND